MGTNYDLHINCCDHCDRPEHKLHIGKQSSGWRFCFRYYAKEEWSGWPDGLRSFNDWVDLIKQVDNRIVDEYGRWVDDQTFIIACAASKAEGKSQWHDHRSEYRAGQIFLDDEGFTLLDVDFS